MNPQNLFAGLTGPVDREIIQTLLDAGNIRIEQIISHGCASAPGYWYDQDDNEWVVLLRGTAAIRFEDQSTMQLAVGDYILIQSHRKHRVEQASAEALWLAVHYPEGVGPKS